ncbi:unnamed protein product [Schistocephalus solidus]|uniref:C2H2-type domain-containing protein n=1 Tax=Schistocephalus solidus TaxID=70667 RepID=A0A183TFH4_SCHSO|nr:unnamed protein product [Schistocephalus solidus]
MNQPPPSAEFNAPRINVNGAQLKNVETFTYLGSTQSRNTRIDDEVAQRISKASQAFGRLQPSVWNRNAIYEANRIATAKAKRTARKLPAPRPNIVDPQALLTCPRCQRIFHARIGLVVHLRTQCTNNPTIPISTSNSANPPSDSSTPTLGINSITATIIETTSLYSSPVTSTTAFAFTTTTTISDGESLLSCPQCDRTFTSRIGLVGHLRIHQTETGEPVPGELTHSRDRHLHCPLCPRTFTHRMGLFSYMRINDSRIRHNADNTDTPCTPSDPAILSSTATPTTMNEIHQPLPIFSAHNVPATSTHASTWLVTCESIARRLVN